MDAGNRNEEAIFKAAIEIDSPEKRAAFVKSACGEDTELLRRVEGLLKFHYDDDRFLKSPPACDGITLDTSPLTEGPGTKIGRYKLLEQIGEGGFGVVYMAEQAEPIRRKVALKIIKLGMDTEQVIARFEAERQALAMMDHPNIARVFDGGATETGRPYFVMELVKGTPITEYCDKNNLDTQQRLELFIDVCKAVQHAHQKGIIHRDIKPSNVMITLHGGKPVPKIIDFGIAKATNQRLTEKTLFTEYQQFIGTPEYMSPEQAEMSGLDIDTRSDIYSLGVLLYELLTGTTPFEAKQLRSAAFDEIIRIIREEEPEKPSTRLSTLGDTLAEIAKHRHVEPAELCKIVRGDLDWVVMRALEKDRTRRYNTVNEFAIDIERHLDDEPVAARPPSTLYRMKKFVRRNRTVVTGVAAVVVVLVGGIVASTIFAVRAEREASISKAVSEFLNEDLLASVDPAKAKGPEVTLRYILDAASGNLEVKFKGSPLAEATVRQTLGETYQKLGEYKAAESHLARALQIRQEQLGKQHPDTLASMNTLARVYRYQGRSDEAEQLQSKVLEIQRRVLGEEHPDTLTSMHNLAVVYWAQARYDEAEQLIIKTLEIRRRVLGEEHPDTLASMRGRAVVYEAQGRYDEAEQIHTKTLEIQRRVLGEEHPETLGSMNNLANVYLAQGRWDEAEQLYIKVLEIRRRVLGEEHPDTLSSMNNLAVVYRDQAHHDEAEQLQSKVLEIQRRVLGEEHPDTLLSMNNLANVYRDQAHYDEAEQLQSKVLEIHRRVLGEEHTATLGSMNNLANMYRDQAHYDEAEQLQSKVLEIQRRVLGEEHPDTLGSMNNLAGVYWAQGRYDEAEQLYSKTLEIRRRVLGEEHPDTLACMNNLANVYGDQSRYEEAEQLYSKTLEILRRVLGEEHPDTLGSMNNLASVYSAQGRHDQAEALHAKTLEILRRVLGEEHPQTLGSMSNLAARYMHRGRYEEAEQLNSEVLEIRRRVLGKEHPRTLWSMKKLAGVYASQDRYEEAEPLLVKVLETQRRVLGEEHPDTLASMHQLALMYAHQGRRAEAEQLFVDTLEMRRRVLGEEHPETLKCAGNLARTYGGQGRYEEAEQLHINTLEIKRRVLGEEHPSTLLSMNNLAWLKATCPAPQVRNGIEAVKYATRLCELTDWKNAGYLDTLAAAYAEAGDFDSAVKWQREAIDLLPEPRAGYESHLKLYQAGKSLAAHQVTQGQTDGQTDEKEVTPEEEE